MSNKYSLAISHVNDICPIVHYIDVSHNPYVKTFGRKSGMRNNCGRSASLLEFSRRNARSAVRQLACFIAEVAPVLISIYTVVDVALSQNAGSR